MENAVLLVTTNMLIQQVFKLFLMTNLTKLPGLPRSARASSTSSTAQPASAQFLVSTRYFELGSVVITFVAVIVCGVAIAHLRMSGMGLLLFPALVAFGVLIHYALLLMLMSLAFWMTRAQGFMYAYYNVFQIARLPREAFHGVARIVFTWTVPLLLIANVPARTLLHGLNGLGSWQGWPARRRS